MNLSQPFSLIIYFKLKCIYVSNLKYRNFIDLYVKMAIINLTW